MDLNNNSIGCMRTKNVQDDLDCRDVWGIDRSFIKNKKQYLMEGDILISSANSWNLVGKGCWIPKLDYECTFGGFISVLRANDEKVFPRYLYYWYTSNEIQNKIRSFGQKTTNISNLNLERCSDLELPTPPLPEQKRIAAILDKADSLRRKNQQAIQLADKFLRAVFLDMFGDPVTNPKGWQKYPIDNVGRVITGSTPPSTKYGMFGSEIPFVTPGDLDSNLETVNRWLSLEGRNFSRICRAGSLMACCIGATIGKVGIANSESAFNQQINVVEWTNLVDDMFGYYLFKMNPSFITENAIKTTLPILKKSLFEKIEIPVPPIHLQKQYSEKALAVKKILVKLSKTPDLMLFNSLSQKAFAGEL